MFFFLFAVIKRVTKMLIDQSEMTILANICAGIL